MQARIRGNILMAWSNRTGAMVLSTGNKSELAVGYCTLYGDMAGGLALLGDVYKTMVYRVARWLNRERAVIPESSITKPPSAELRPNQTDQDSLPPYDVLDGILKLYIEEWQEVDAIVAAGFDRELVAAHPEARRHERVQAPPGRADAPRVDQSLRQRTPDADRATVAPRTKRVQCCDRDLAFMHRCSLHRTNIRSRAVACRCPQNEKTLYVRTLLGHEKTREAKGGNDRVFSQPVEEYVRRIDDAYARGDRRTVDAIFETMGDR